MRFFMTFGVQYSYQEHPFWPAADPDGWVLVEAADGGQARELVVAEFGQKWSMLDDEEPEARFFPRGEIGRLDGAGFTPGVRP